MNRRTISGREETSTPWVRDDRSTDQTWTDTITCACVIVAVMVQARRVEAEAAEEEDVEVLEVEVLEVGEVAVEEERMVMVMAAPVEEEECITISPP